MTFTSKLLKSATKVLFKKGVRVAELVAHWLVILEACGLNLGSGRRKLITLFHSFRDINCGMDKIVHPGGYYSKL